MTTYPYTIGNGAGEWLTFLGLVPDPAGDRLEVENRVRPGAGPPMHVHHRQRESLTVCQGKIGYRRLGGESRFGVAGDTLVFEAGEAHRFWNAGDDDLVCSGFVQPADNVEYFLAALFASTKGNRGRRPHPLDAAYLLRRYRSELGIVEIPIVVQRLVFPVQVALGTLLGRYRKYAGAPEPLR